MVVGVMEALRNGRKLSLDSWPLRRPAVFLAAMPFLAAGMDTGEFTRRIIILLVCFWRA